MKVLSRSKSQNQSRVLSFTSATPSMEGTGSEDSPSKEEYRQSLMKVLSRSKSQNQSRVLSFTSATPSMEGKLLLS